MEREGRAAQRFLPRGRMPCGSPGPWGNPHAQGFPDAYFTVRVDVTLILVSDSYFYKTTFELISNYFNNLVCFAECTKKMDAVRQGSATSFRKRGQTVSLLGFAGRVALGRSHSAATQSVQERGALLPVSGM